MSRLFKFTTVTFLCCAFALGVGAQEREYDYMKAKGYFNFGDVSEFADGDEMVEVELTQPLLGLFAPMMDEDDPDLGEVLKNLQLVNVRVFSVRRNVEEDVLTRMNNLSGQLEDEDWESIVRVRGREENISVFIKMSNAEKGKPATPDTAIEGLVVLALDDYEAAFVNIVGKFGMEEIQKMGRHFNLPGDNWDDDDWKPRRRSRSGEADEEDDGDSY